MDIAVLAHGGRITGDEIAYIVAAVVPLAALVTAAIRRDSNLAAVPADDESAAHPTHRAHR